MNTTATYSSAEHSWSRRCSTETIFSIQGKETDIARDTSDTEALDSDTLEYEPVTESDEDGPVDPDTTECSDNDIIETKVIEVSLVEGDLVFADSERTGSGSEGASHGSDSEMDFHDYWHCAQCRAANNNPLYRYCQKCFTVRKNFFPPRPRRKHKREASIPGTASQPLSQYSSMSSQPLSQDSGVDSPHSQELQDPQDPQDPQGASHSKTQPVTSKTKKRRSSSADKVTKRAKYSESSDSESESEKVKPLVKTISDPAITIESAITKKVLANSLIDQDARELCVICITEPKTGVFVHGRIAHICCCYKCAKKVWAKAKRCPVCNCKISNVLKAVVM